MFNKAPPGKPILIPEQNESQFTEGSNATLLCVTSGGNPPPALSFCKISLSSRVTNVTNCLPVNSGPWNNTMWGHVSSSFGRVLLGKKANFSKTTATVMWTPTIEDNGATVYCTAASYSHSDTRVNPVSSNMTLTVRCMQLILLKRTIPLFQMLISHYQTDNKPAFACALLIVNCFYLI